MNILIIDNYDSFTFNLVKLVRDISNTEPVVKRNDECSLTEAAAYDKILISPGPGIPVEAGIILALIDRYSASKSILGVCLGHQAIAEAFGATLLRLPSVYHGIATRINLCTNNKLFRNMDPCITVGRYHSWGIAPESLPAELQVLSADEDGNVMAIKHKKHEVYGVQFHPESVMTPQGSQIMANWINN